MTSTSTVVTSTDVAAVLEQTWHAYIEADNGAPLVVAEADHRPVPVIASVSLTGAYSGHVSIGCSVHAAEAITGQLLDVPVDEVTDADLIDAMGEVANILCGNVKSLLPQPTALSLPSVSTHGEGTMHWPGTHIAADVTATWHNEPIHVQVLAADPA